MPNQVDGVLLHTMSGTELSRVRTELQRLRILPTISPHPVQPNRQPAAHRHLGNALLPTHRQVHVPTSPVRIGPYRRLRCLHQQEAQQGVALLADVSQPLPAGTGVLARNQPHVAADLLATMEIDFGVPMISTKASAVSGPTPGCVISRSTSGRFLASCSTAAVNSSIVGFSGPAAPVILAGADWPREPMRASLAAARPCSLNSFFFQR